MVYLDRYKEWCDADLTANEKMELHTLADNTEELKSRFGSELQFGTAGMRGVMGIGSNRLNRYTVRRAAQGMAAWLLTTDLPKRAAIGYDSRHNSALFAQVCAVAFAEQGIEVRLFDRLAPTPMLSYAVRELKCGCGIVISASHNSGEYNGVKCYGPDGCQMTDEPAKVVIDKISEIAYFMPEQNSFEELRKANTIRYIDQSLWEMYYDKVLAEAIQPEVIRKSGLSIVYTPLCGTGNEPVREVLDRLGVDITVVSCQEKPDGDFKTCEYPNPETDAALAESYKIADKINCDVILGTDPDCDRVAIAVPTDGGYRKLSGNELGCLLLEYILKSRSARENLPQNGVVVRSIVSSPLADCIAQRHNITAKAVLTGFKYIGGEILALEEKGEEDRFIFGFEESCGYLKGTYARDKDAVVASMLVCEMAADLKSNGKTICNALNDMYANYGYYLAHVQSVELTGADAMEKASKIMSDLREASPSSIGGVTVTKVCDYQKREVLETESARRSEINLPRSNVLEFVLGTQGSVIVRPSGTEPKVKFYYTAVGTTEAGAKQLLDKLVNQMSL